MDFDSYLQQLIPNSKLKIDWTKATLSSGTRWNSLFSGEDFYTLEQTLTALLAGLMELDGGVNLFRGELPIEQNNALALRIVKFDPISNGITREFTLECTARFDYPHTVANIILKLGSKLPFKQWCTVSNNSTFVANILNLEFIDHPIINISKHNANKVVNLNFQLTAKLAL